MGGEGRIPLARPWLAPEAAEAVQSVLASGRLVRGARVAAFERAVAAVVGVPFGLAVSSGTAAIELALVAVGVGPGDEVVLPDFTFPALSNVVEHLGAVPVTVDVSLETLNASSEELLTAVGRRTRCVVPVHQFGLPVDLGPLLEMAPVRGFTVVEDAACALGARRGGTACGAFGAVGCFSFHPRKVVTTGEGGAVTTSDPALFHAMARLSSHGMDMAVPAAERFVEAGYNFRLGELAAAAAAGQMERLEWLLAERRRVAAAYLGSLGGVAGVIVPSGLRDPEHTYQSFVVLVEEGVRRDAVLAGLASRGVEATIGSYAIHAQPHFRQRFPDAAGEGRPGSAAAFARSVALPLYVGMGPDDVARVVEALAAAVAEAW